jgi:ribosomal protein S27E
MSNVLSFKLPTKKHKTDIDKTTVENTPTTEEIQVMLCESCGGKTFLLSSQTTDIYCSSCLVPVYILQWGEK